MANNIISLIVSPPFPGPILFLKIIFLGLSLILSVVIIVLLFRTRWLRFRFLEDIFEFFTYRPYGVKKLVKQWAKIKGRLEVGFESEYKLAVIEADSILDDILKKLGYAGDTLGEKLDNVTSAVIPGVEDAREAHKIRNNIVHDPDYMLDSDTVKRTISTYEKVLTDLGAL